MAGCGDSNTAVQSAVEQGATGATTAVQAEDLASGNQSASLAAKVKGPVNVTFRKITIPPGAGTGKHCHDGNLIAVVKQGTLTHYAPIYPSGVHEYHAGDSIFEGSGYVHEGKNLGKEKVVLYVTYVTPKGDPLAETDLSHCDAG
ncbi:MAG: cupin domain-containing protein [Solirubrobacterales bacterium]